MYALTAKLAGRRYHPAEIEPTSSLLLVRDRTNPADPNAVQVRTDGRLAGYLESGLASLVARLIDRGRPVFASPIKGKQNLVNLFVPSPRDRLAPRRGANLRLAQSSDSRRYYVVDVRRRLCTCPAGRVMLCRHLKAAGALPAPSPQQAIVGAVAANA